MKKTHFYSVDVPKFKTEFAQLLDRITNLQDSVQLKYPLLVESNLHVSDFAPYFYTIEMLYHGRMIPYHWDCFLKNARNLMSIMVKSRLMT
jgi:hypothetical protein